MMDTTDAHPSNDRKPRAISYPTLLTAWGLAAFGVSLSGVLADAPRLLTPVIILWAPLLTLVLYRRSAAVRGLCETIPIRTLLSVHVPRAPIGLMFLVLSARGLLHPTFATVAGYGDIAAGSLALVGLGLLPAIGAVRRRALLAINLVGLIDMLAVIVTAQRILIFSDEFEQLNLVRVFPYSLIPLVLVPWILISHGLLFVRLWRRGG